ncbi:MAG: cobalamin-dependent protein [Acidobacteriota bacterium]|nr:cobalamin-dependent protein [Acidobacteriota bacterium]
MSTAGFDARTVLSAVLRRGKVRVADQATEAFLLNHPEMLARLGERARQFGREDAAYHIDFLAGAVESGNPAAFGDYIRWVVRVLTPRGLPSSMVAETLLQIEDGFRKVMSVEDQLTLRPYIVAGLDGCSAASPAATAPPSVAPLAGAQQIFLQRILAADRRAAATVARETLAQGHELMDVYVDLVQESLYELGRLWEGNRITVAQEHAGTAVCQYVLAELYSSIPAPGRRRGRAILTGVEGEFHQVGANLVADALDADGWNVRFLGANTPRAGVLQALGEHDAEVLAISVTMLFNVGMTHQLVREARAQRPSLFVIVGGAAFRAAPDLWREVGADARAADVRTAVAAMRERI